MRWARERQRLALNLVETLDVSLILSVRSMLACILTLKSGIIIPIKQIGHENKQKSLSNYELSSPRLSSSSYLGATHYSCFLQNVTKTSFFQLNQKQILFLYKHQFTNQHNLRRQRDIDVLGNNSLLNET